MSGTQSKGVVRIGLDDTDHVDHACTTEHFHRLLTMLEGKIEEFRVLERRLVRLWPFAPTRTRGNAALAAVCECDFESLAVLRKVCDEFIRALAVEFENSYPKQGQRADPCLLVSSVELPESLYWEAVRREVSVAERSSQMPEEVTIHSLSPSPQGIIGACAAIAWAPQESSTLELIAWREEKKIRTTRAVSNEAIIEMSERFSGTFANRDPTTGRGMIMPRTNCPVLYGVRGDSAEELYEAHRFLQDRDDVENCESWAIHRTNQVSDDHLTGFLSGVVTAIPIEVQGGHSSVRVWDGETSLTLVAFAESGPVNSLLRRSRPGDVIDWLGLISPSGEVHLERIRLNSNMPRPITRPFCCDKAMRSAGKGQGLRCTVCGTLRDKVWLADSIDTPAKFEGWVEPSAANRRHLARPLARGLPKSANAQG